MEDVVRRLACAALAAAALGTPAVASANGQTAHQWITRRAVDALPPGALKSLLTSPSAEKPLLNGTMFPDGGYPQNDDYGEMAHWEPFQNAYREWIRANHGRPYAGAAVEHVAFLMGMASHGLADTTHDAMYMERSKQIDGWPPEPKGFDESTDVVFASQVGAGTVPAQWMPTSVLLDLFHQQGHDVNVFKLTYGQTLLGGAITGVGGLAIVPPTVAQYKAHYPWGTAHLADPEVPGSPADEAVAVAKYWQWIWERLNGAAPSPAVIHHWPRDRAYGHPTDHTKVEARLTLVFREGLEASSVGQGAIEVKDGAGRSYPLGYHLFYGRSSHVLNVSPQQDWAANEDFVVTVVANKLRGIENSGAPQWSFRFSTRPGPPPPPDAGASPSDSGAGTDSGSGAGDAAPPKTPDAAAPSPPGGTSGTAGSAGTGTAGTAGAAGTPGSAGTAGNGATAPASGEASDTPVSPAGCGCSVAGGDARARTAAAGLGLAIAAALRRRRNRPRA